jgi:hypothetical protein
MRKTGTALVMATAAGALALVTSGVANAATAITISDKAIQTSFKFIKDTPPKKQINPGDQFSFLETLKQGSKQIGSDKVILTVVSKTQAVADGTFTFKTGTLHAHGPVPVNIRPGQTIVVPIVGGTGAYKGAHGTLHVTSGKGNISTQVFHFTV